MRPGQARRRDLADGKGQAQTGLASLEIDLTRSPGADLPWPLGGREKPPARPAKVPIGGQILSLSVRDLSRGPGP
jgi:hypothetical protein